MTRGKAESGFVTTLAPAPKGAPPLPGHLYWLCRDAARQELKAVPGLMTAVELNFYVLTWAFAYFSGRDQDHARARLERVYRLRAAEPVPEGAKVYPVPLTAPLKHCRSCLAPLYWGVTEAGKAVPLNPNGTSHFTTCPNAKAHSKGSS